ncbi:MAG TPA: CdaR family protein [Sandaracinaceae bacterium LLY-WYZ-13_1]|nr:CdaR family protein [Sandaracinaceae bacterium LLY-WYZ-13_1]
MSVATTGKGFVRSALTDNVGLKIVALVASIGLFVIVRGTEDAQISIAVDVVALLPPPSSDRMLVSEIPDEIRVTLRGSRSVLNAVRRGGMQPIQMDLRDASAHFYYFEQEELELPAGATIVQIAPAAVPLTWVDRAERRLRIEPVLRGDVAEGNLLVGTVVEPSSVVVRGAASEVNRLEAIRTEPVDVEDLGEGRHERRVPLTPLPEHVNYVDTVAVMVTVTIEEEEGQRTYADAEVLTVGGTDVALRPSAVTVEVTGPRARVDDLHPRRVIPFVDVSELDREGGAQPLPVQLRPLPEGMRGRVEPAEILAVPR